MSKPQFVFINADTGEEIVRDATDAELTQYAKDKADDEARKAEAEAKAAQRQALLSRLGITEEEARILLG